MKLQTVRVRRSRPSTLALALALMLTMLFVYLASLSAPSDGADDTVSAAAPGSGEVRMEGLTATFECEGRYENQLEARIAAARCAQTGGAGLILADASGYAVIQDAVEASEAPEDALTLNADGLTLRMNGAASEIAALSDAVAFLRAQATETGSLAQSLERGDTDAASLRALMEIYRTQGTRVLTALETIESSSPVVERLNSAAGAALLRLNDAAENPAPGQLRLVHAGACAEWIGLLKDLKAQI